MVFFPIGWESMIYPAAIADYESFTVLHLDIHNAKEQKSARPKNDATTLGNDFTTGRKQTAGFALQTALSTWPPAGSVTACPATADTGFHPTSSATRCGSIIASRSASETWRTCWPAGVSTSPMRPSGSGVGGSVLSMRADYGADVAGSATPGISTRCSSRSRVASSTCGAPWMRPVTSSTFSCNRDEIGTPRCDSFASC